MITGESTTSTNHMDRSKASSSCPPQNQGEIAFGAGPRVPFQKKMKHIRRQSVTQNLTFTALNIHFHQGLPITEGT
jgi:hypothetical protein